MIRNLIAIISLCALVACGSPSATEPQAPTDPAGSAPAQGEYWYQSGHGPEGDIPRFPDSVTFIEFSEREVNGNAMCNHFFGPVEIDDSSFDASGIGSTEMGCLPRRRMDAEYNFLEALRRADTIVVEGERLTLTGPSIELVFRFHEPPPTPELAGTRWKLNGLAHGRGSYATVQSVDPGVLILVPNGKITGTTGCRRFTALWELSGERVDVSEFELLGECSGDADQDAHVQQVLSSGFTYEIREQSLQLYQIDGDLGLDYTTGLR